LFSARLPAIFADGAFSPVAGATAGRDGIAKDLGASEAEEFSDDWSGIIMHTPEKGRK
jgi:hypothetical protein